MTSDNCDLFVSEIKVVFGMQAESAVIMECNTVLQLEIVCFA